MGSFNRLILCYSKCGLCHWTPSGLKKTCQTFTHVWFQRTQIFQPPVEVHLDRHRWHKVQVFTQLTEIKTAVQWSGSVFVQQNMFLIIKGLLRNGCRQLFRLSICPLVCSPSLPGMLTCIFSLPPPFSPLTLSLFLLNPPLSVSFLWMQTVIFN